MTRKTDDKGRVTLFSDFANQTVVVERVNDDEVRIRKVRLAPKRKYRLKDLLAQVTDDNLHPFVDSGPPVGNEAL